MKKALEKILRGILKFRATGKHEPVLEKNFKEITNNNNNNNNPRVPSSIFIACIDSRLMIYKFADLEAGDSFVLRNAGNLVPAIETLSYNSVTSVHAAMELSCMNDVKHVFICGHSDCMAIKTLYALKDQCHDHSGGALHMWIKKYGAPSAKMFIELSKNDSNRIEPVSFKGKFSHLNFQAFIDPENRFSIEDKCSQLNCLQQIHHVASFPFVQERLQRGQLQIHAMWFDVHAGDVYFFSRNNKRFLEINEKTFEELLKECYPQD